MVTIDELFELSIRVLSKFPKIRGCVSFAKTANKIGLAKIYKRFITVLIGLRS